MKSFVTLSFLIALVSILHSQPIALDTSSSECDRLKTSGYSLKQSGQYRQENDTFRVYIEHCANQRGSFHQFSALNGAVQFMSDDNNRWLEYRDWLKKVLYLNMDTFYYCSDVHSILTTFQYLKPLQGEDLNGYVSVLDYILQNNRCPADTSYFLDLRRTTRDKQIMVWRDTVKDSTKTPIDTANVSLESLDLQILRGIQFAVSPSPIHVGNRIATFIASQNPFTNETTLRYNLNDATLTRVEIYDALGNVVYSSGEGLQESGEHSIQIDGKTYSSGSYYARLSTFSGEVKTIKLEHLK